MKEFQSFEMLLRRRDEAHAFTLPEVCNACAFLGQCSN